MSAPAIAPKRLIENAAVPWPAAVPPSESLNVVNLPSSAPQLVKSALSPLYDLPTSEDRGIDPVGKTETVLHEDMQSHAR
jgi:hypothetical protein